MAVLQHQYCLPKKSSQAFCASACIPVQLFTCIWTYQDAGVEFVEALHRAVAEAVAQVLLHKIRMVQNVVRHERFLRT